METKSVGARILVKQNGIMNELPCGPLMTIGRIAPNDIILPDGKISRQHAAIRQFGDGNYYIMDTGSSNGTFLNGRQIITPTSLSNGDTIAVGNQTLCFVCDETAPEDEDGIGEEAARTTMMTMGSSIKKITLLVSDIRGYTQISEQMPPDALATLLQRWWRIITEIVERHGGTVDKFIGDAVMVRWIADPADVTKTVMAALRAADELGRAADRMNQDNPTLPLPFRIGVGINSGQAMLGNIGANVHRDYTAIGDAVNVTFRIEAETRKLERDVVVGPESLKVFPADARRKYHRQVTVKGKSAPIDICAFTFAELAALLPGLPVKS